MLVLGAGRIQATSLTLDNVPSEVNAEESFEASVQFLTSAKNTNYYLAGVFYKTSGNGLFGLTEVSGNMVSLSASPSSFYQITTSEEGSWSGKLRVKADIKDPGFKGEGDYWLRIDRFTGKSTSPAESSNPVGIRIKYIPPPTPPPTPEPTASKATPTPTPPPTPKATAGEASPIPSPTPSPSPTKRPGLTQAKMPALVAPTASAASAPAVLGAIDTEVTTTSAASNKTAPTLILIGSLLLSGGILPLALKWFPRLE